MLTSPATIEFEIQPSPSYQLLDDYSIFLEITCSNTDGSNTVTPTFVEGFFDEVCIQLVTVY